jgi:hypothetical protein
MEIFECTVGSHLYGTNHEKSDMDFCGVFMPTFKELCGIYGAPEEIKMNVKLSEGDRNEQGDIDRKFWSLQRFAKLVSQGQSLPTEMLFAPPEMIVKQSAGWENLKNELIRLGVSKKSVAPFMGFCTAQAHKSTIKIENLKLIQKLIESLEKHPSHSPLGSAFAVVGSVQPITEIALFDDLSLSFPVVEDKTGTPMIELAGRFFLLTASIKTALDALVKLEGKYGARTRGEISNRCLTDRKSLLHAYRMIAESEELLTTGKITLPLPADKIAFLTEIRTGKRDNDDHFSILHSEVDRVYQLVDASPLRETPDIDGINDLLYAFNYDYIFDSGWSIPHRG